MKKTSDTHQTVILPKDLIEMLRLKAKENHRSLANMAEVALNEWFQGQKKNHNGHLGGNKE